MSGGSTWPGRGRGRCARGKGWPGTVPCGLAGRRTRTRAWYYPHPSPLARRIRNYVAFWNGVQVNAQEGAQAETGVAASPARGAAPDAGIACRPEG
ncbi:MAG TPA: DUF427 domain-containing protein [Streptosporangiaceae bacterium]|nr:DUF427 domain-containing protein [Streptosporangiaceae bacterium]